MATPHRACAALTGLASVLLLAGCGQEPATPAQPTSSAPRDVWPADAKPASTEVPDPTGTASGSTDDPEAVPEQTELPKDLVTRVGKEAGRFIQTYAKPPSGVSAATWWGEVRPYLTKEAAEDLKISPDEAPFTKQTTTAAVTRGEGTDLVAAVGTDKGAWDVTFARTSDDRLLVKDLAKNSTATTSAPATSAPTTSTKTAKK